VRGSISVGVGSVTIVTIKGFTNVGAAVTVTDHGAAPVDDQPPADPIIFACLFEALPADEKRTQSARLPERGLSVPAG
jgi:hypothetical protein